jgi:hypothetical protein
MERAEIDPLREELSTLHQLVEDFQWNAIRFPSHAISVAGSAAPPATDTDNTLLFDSAATFESVVVSVRMPHGWNQGTSLIPKVHWTKKSAGAGNVVWQVRYRIASVGKVLSSWSGWTTSTDITPYPTPNDADMHNLASLPEIDMSSYSGFTPVLLVQIGRDPAHSEDTYVADDAKLLEFDLLYRSSRMGSRSEGQQ